VDRRIVDATRTLLREGGLGAVKVSEVARRAGVTRPTVYRRHPDAESLAIAVLHADLERVAVGPSQDVPRDRPILEQLLALVAPIYDYYAEHPEVSKALLQLAFFGRADPEAPLQQQLMGFLADVGGRMHEAQARGELREDTDIATLVGAFFALYITTANVLIQDVDMGTPDALALLERLLGQHLRGL